MEHLCWKSTFYNTAEKCMVEHGPKGMAVTSRIEGAYNGQLLLVDYEITLTPDWETVAFRVDARYDELIVAFGGKRVNGRWIVNGEDLSDSHSCIDIDISLTPFTNTLPLKRLVPESEAQIRIDVLYIDILENTIGRRQQQYKRLSDHCYRFETIPKDFEADILFDEDGFVDQYPALFERIGCDLNTVE